MVASEMAFNLAPLHIECYWSFYTCDDHDYFLRLLWSYFEFWGHLERIFSPINFNFKSTLTLTSNKLRFEIKVNLNIMIKRMNLEYDSTLKTNLIT